MYCILGHAILYAVNLAFLQCGIFETDTNSTFLTIAKWYPVIKGGHWNQSKPEKMYVLNSGLYKGLLYVFCTPSVDNGTLQSYNQIVNRRAILLFQCTVCYLLLKWE